MEYSHIAKARFCSRPNRFVAWVELEGQQVAVHVKNTGRCAELLVPGCTVYLEQSSNPARKTPYDLVAVEKGALLINMDSAAPNQVVKEWLLEGGLGPLQQLRPEYRMGDSRFDFYGIQQDGQPFLMEVKGCTLEEDGLVRFPDAPTLRGLKHVQELTQLAKEGWRCYVMIVIQMKGVHTFTPNWDTQPAFGHALQAAQQADVTLLAYDCKVTPSQLRLDQPVPICLDLPKNLD